MPEIIPPGPRIPEPKRRDLGRFVTGIERCRARAQKNPVVVGLPEGLDHREIATQLVSSLRGEGEYVVVDAEELAKGSHPAIKDIRGKKGIIVTNYSPRFTGEAFENGTYKRDVIESKNGENNIQVFIRSAIANNYVADAIVLSDGRPDSRSFEHGFWWVNGPFADYAIWEVQDIGESVKPVQLRKTVDAKWNPIWEEVIR